MLLQWNWYSTHIGTDYILFIYFCITATLVGSMFKYIWMYVNPISFKGLKMKPSLNTKRCLPQTNVLSLQVIHIESLSLSYHENYYLLYFKYFRCFFHGFSKIMCRRMKLYVGEEYCVCICLSVSVEIMRFSSYWDTGFII